MYHHARRKAFTSMFSASSRASEHAADFLKRNVGSFCFASPSSSASSLRRTHSGKSLSHGYRRRHQQHQREAASNARRQHQRAFTHSSSSQQQQRFGGGGGGGGRRGAAAAAAKSKSISDKNQNMLYYLLAVTSFTVGASYASVPLYRAFCRATGFGGTTQRKSIEDKMEERDQMDKSILEKAKKRSIEITFNADVAEGLPWKFTPTQKKVTVTPGETVLAFYTAENTSSSAITGVATYNVQPGKAGQYFNKIQCFCFEEQRLRAKEKVDMPVFFYLDPEFASDRGMEDVNSLVLSYTFFQSEDFDGDEYDESTEDYGRDGGGGSGVKLHGHGPLVATNDGKKLVNISSSQ